MKIRPAGTIASVFVAATMLQCTEGHEKVASTEVKAPVKPSATYRDTLELPPFSAVFYRPDSLQLQKIRALTGEQVFTSSMHEYESQVNYATRFLKTDRKDIHVYATDRARFLLFKNKNKIYTIDLDHYDPVGLFVFDGKKAPAPMDMMNVETQVNEYFRNDSP